MNEQIHFLSGTGVGLVFPPWDGLAPWALPPSAGTAATEAQPG
jgi:hypothetical protein